MKGTEMVGRRARRGRNVLLALVAACVMGLTVAPGASAGPVVLMGIDAEDGGPGGHGSTQIYSDVMTSMLADTTNGGDGILVVGGGKSVGDNVTAFWDLVGTQTSEPITYVNGAGISSQSLAGFQAVAVVSSVFETGSGGLTQAENDALAGRGPELASFVNGGGGLMGFSQTGLTNTYAYLPDAGQYTFNTGLSFSDVEATPAGEAVGLGDTSLDLCCWHDEYLTFPSYVEVLATNVQSSNAVALGGEEVTLPEVCTNGVDDDGDALVDAADPDCVVAAPGPCGFPVTGKSDSGTDAGEVITGTPDSDLLSGDSGDDTINGLDGPDCMYGNRDNDTMDGGAGGDVMRGGRNADVMNGGDGDDELRLQDGRDVANGGAGDDTIKAQGKKRNPGGIDKVDCGDGDDRVTADRWDKVKRNCEQVRIVN